MLDNRIDVSRIQLVAEGIKQEKKLFPTEDDRYRPLGFMIKYRVGEKVQKLIVIGHLWNRRLDIIHNGDGGIVEEVGPQVEREMVKIITFFRDFYF